METLVAALAMVAFTYGSAVGWLERRAWEWVPTHEARMYGGGAR